MIVDRSGRTLPSMAGESQPRTKLENIRQMRYEEIRETRRFEKGSRFPADPISEPGRTPFGRGPGRLCRMFPQEFKSDMFIATESIVRIIRSRKGRTG